jgi:rod shape-determining protein MreB
MVVSKLVGLFSTDMGIDLGTANSLVSVCGRGIVLSEPSVVAVKKGTNTVLLGGNAVGQAAKEMLGRTPASIEAIRPLKAGVIADFDITEAMINYFIRKIHNRSRWFSPRVVFSIPSGITAVEKRAIYNSAERAGAREVYLIEEPRAAGLGAGLPIHEPTGNMIVDVGAGTTEVAVLSLADVVVCTNMRVAGDDMDLAICQHMKKNYNILIGQNTAERIKITVGSAIPLEDEYTLEVNGRDAIAGLPRSVTVNSEEIREALKEPVFQIIEGIRSTLEKTGPELSADLVHRGITLCGGGVLLRGFERLVREETGLPVHFPDDPLKAVIHGLTIIIEHLDAFKDILESAEDDL